jgi:hypothetical protein
LERSSPSPGHRLICLIHRPDDISSRVNNCLEFFFNRQLFRRLRAARSWRRFSRGATLPLLKRERSHEIEQSQVTKARYITLSPIHVSKDEQRQSPPRPFMMFHVWRECLAHGIERSTHRF